MSHKLDMEKIGMRQIGLLEEILERLGALLGSVGKCDEDRRAATLSFSVGPKRPKRKVVMFPIKLTADQEVTVTLAPKTLSGKPAKVDGMPVWEVLSGRAQVIPSADGLSADFVAPDLADDEEQDVTTVKVTADADRGEGVRELSDTIECTTTGEEANNFGFTMSAPRPKRTGGEQPA